MHPYVSEARNRGGLYIGVAVVAVACAFASSKLIDLLEIQVPWWVETPSVLGFYGVFWKSFDLWWWPTRFSRTLGWTTAPDLRGEWDATVTTTFADKPAGSTGTATIRQTSSRLRVSIRWEKSSSYSVAGVVQNSPTAAPELIYQYVNRPDPDAVSTMHTHRGTAWLEMRGPGEMIGEYFSGRDREQWGHMKLVRKPQ
jgi:hypothetical protein